MNSFLLRQKGVISFFVIVFMFTCTNESFGQLTLDLQLGTSGQDTTLENTSNIIMEDCFELGSNDLNFNFENAFDCSMTIQSLSFSDIWSGNVLYSGENISPLMLSGEVFNFAITTDGSYNSYYPSVDHFVISVDVVVILHCKDGIEKEIKGTINITYEFCEENEGGEAVLPYHDNGPKSSRQRGIVVNTEVSPNPTKGTFSLVYSIENSVEVNISIYNAVGQKIKTLVNEKQDKGTYNISESLSSDLGEGIYYIVYNIDGNITSTKLMKL